jgi:hypothetical protein
MDLVLGVGVGMVFREDRLVIHDQNATRTEGVVNHRGDAGEEGFLRFWSRGRSSKYFM